MLIHRHIIRPFNYQLCSTRQSHMRLLKSIFVCFLTVFFAETSIANGSNDSIYINESIFAKTTSLKSYLRNYETKNLAPIHSRKPTIRFQKLKLVVMVMMPLIFKAIQFPARQGERVRFDSNLGSNRCLQFLAPAIKTIWVAWNTIQIQQEMTKFLVSIALDLYKSLYCSRRAPSKNKRSYCPKHQKN